MSRHYIRLRAAHASNRDIEVMKDEEQIVVDLGGNVRAFLGFNGVVELCAEDSKRQIDLRDRWDDFDEDLHVHHLANDPVEYAKSIFPEHFGEEAA